MRTILPTVLCAVLIAPASAFAADLETLVMPGPVIQGHADVEEECTSCHRPFDRAAEKGLCLECHEDVAADLEARKGFHGLAPGIPAAACRSCHPDHLGREADVSGLNPDLFDHALTDYPLRGAHQGLACQTCHEPEDKHRDAPADCVSCHRADDPHKERLGTECGDCHEEVSWKKARFDHDTTKFALTGKHKDVACGLCHAGERYQDTPTDCQSCHQVDDVHRGEFGPGCDSCHDVAGWKKARFDHDRDTDFPLTGRHVLAACASCHTGSLHDPLPTDCQSCHEPDDVHRAQFGPRCGDCHDTKTWARVKFDHDRDTKFALRGAHDSLACTTCHAGHLYDDALGQDCLSCHEADDVHKGQQGPRCETCHDERSWSGEVRFDHELSRFPLLGLHASVACEECHPTAAYKDAQTACIACHRPDDSHERTLGEACGVCHNPNGWPVWRFDHTTQTTFVLHGAHEGVDCRSCHSSPVKHEIDLGDQCIDCHAAEDVHRGSFGTRCEQCHAERAWDEVQLKRGRTQP